MSRGERLRATVSGVLAAVAASGLLAVRSELESDDARGTLAADVNASEWPGSQAEVSIAVDPFDASRVLAVAMNVPDGRILSMSSADGGATWSQTPVPIALGSVIDNDPMAAFDARGTAFLARIPVSAAGSLGIEVLRSFDGGRTWEPPVRISHNEGRDDKLALTVDDGPESPFRDRVYVAWKWPRGGVFASRSLDSGRSFSTPQPLEDAVVTGLDLAVDSGGVVYLAFNDLRRRAIRVLKSVDGGVTFAPSVKVADVRAGAFVHPPSQCLRQALVHASAAADRSKAPTSGNLYVTWSDYPPGVDIGQCPDLCTSMSLCAPAVYFSRSTDGGASWSAPLRLGEESAEPTDRYHQWLRVDAADGAISVAFKDSRNDPTRASADVYLVRSADGGDSWEPSIRISSAGSVARHPIQFGDYQGLAAALGTVYVAWSDYRDDPFAGDIHVRRLSRPADVAQRDPARRLPGARPTPRELAPPRP